MTTGARVGLVGRGMIGRRYAEGASTIRLVRNRRPHRSESGRRFGHRVIRRLAHRKRRLNLARGAVVGDSLGQSERRGCACHVRLARHMLYKDIAEMCELCDEPHGGARHVCRGRNGVVRLPHLCRSTGGVRCRCRCCRRTLSCPRRRSQTDSLRCSQLPVVVARIVTIAPLSVDAVTTTVYSPRSSRAT